MGEKTDNERDIWKNLFLLKELFLVSGKKILFMVLLILVLVGSVVSGLYWNLQNYVLVDLQFYPRNEQQLDLRGQDISVRGYEKLSRKLPECEILWDVPFQGNTLPHDTRQITVSHLTREDLQTLAYFKDLETVDAQGCTDYENLLDLRQDRPDLQVEYSLTLGTQTYAGTAAQVALDTLTEADVENLCYLPDLQSVHCGGGEETAIRKLQEYCREHGVEFCITLGGEPIAPDAKEVIAGAITDEQIPLLRFLPNMEKLHIRNPEASAENLLALRDSLPQVKVTWEQEICGTVLSSDVKELDLSGEKVTDLQELKKKMPYFPNAETVFLGECGVDNETLAAHREQVREAYKLVWTVNCGSKLKSRTDAKTFMPVRESVYYFNDEEAYNLRYCEEMVCIDIGHMSIHNIDFVEYMPDLEYLILAHTQLNYIEPIKHCQKLKFLELDWSPIKDLTPLKECKALEDLNLGNTFADFEPIKDMTWLKNLWMIDCSTRARYEMTQALPGTKVMVTGAATVDNGWRDLDNYYKMRDLLGMHYMSW